ncbi:TadE-like protein [Aliiroseovarius crassostreae]|uniref:TadE-like domain-containing protein n=1 Tax=Aliiroseovarius crassostreae TaxID=154981 RepID=A0A0N8IB50_9RHOB|nr:TadE/TadG family type IV pilus assembly protein [Aliiroseovarius crassostreae]KPN62123.1 hypothetical protein AKJ29_07555 [Aliiroseovarius crassostreae]SFU90973.1 TadE-like protein [Aliiroseovarius crassostreae]
MSKQRKNLRDCDQGSIFVEALLVLPVITLLSVGVLEFGNVLWQRHQVQTGVRDAARYWARCKADTIAYVSNCNETKARNIAFYGTPNPPSPAVLRVPGWDDASELIILPAKADLPGAPDDGDVVYVEALVTYQDSPLFNLLQIDGITLSYAHNQRYIGW